MKKTENRTITIKYMIRKELGLIGLSAVFIFLVLGGFIFCGKKDYVDKEGKILVKKGRI